MAPFFTYLLYSQISKKYLTMETAGSTMDWPGSEISASELFRDRGMMRTTSSLGDEAPRLTVDEVQQLRAQVKHLQSDSNHDAGSTL